MSIFCYMSAVVYKRLVTVWYCYYSNMDLYLLICVI